MIHLLDGIKILDLTTVVLGPYGTQFLADFGADVIKLESLSGDSFRSIRPGHSADMGAGFLNCNRNKRSLCVDLKTSDGQEILTRLIEQVDVVVHNMRGASADRLGLNFTALKAIKANIVLCHAPGFSCRGRRGDDPAYDDIVQAASGLAHLNANAAGEPRFFPTIVSDKVGGMHLAMAVLGAIAYQSRTGQGCEIEAPMFEATVAFAMAEQLSGQSFEPPLGSTGYARLQSPNRRPFPCKDGYIALLPYTSKDWKNFLTLVGEDDLATQEWVMDSVLRSQRVDELYQVVASAMPAKTVQEWCVALKAIDIPFTPVNTLDDMLSEGHLLDVDFFKLTPHPTEGMLRSVRSPFFSNGVPESDDRFAPHLGEHNQEILAELGYSEADIQNLLEQGVIA